MRIGIVGAGSVGGFIGATLAHAGHSVIVLARPGRVASRATLDVSSRLLGEFEVSVDGADHLPRDLDVVVVAVRTFQLDATLTAVDPRGLGDAIIVPFMNGIDHVDTLRDHFGKDAIVAGTIRVEVERTDATHIRQLTPFADVQLGPSISHGSHRNTLATALRDAGLAVILADDEKTVLWTKLAMLAPLALATSASGLDIGGVRIDPDWNARLVACCTEACAVARADGATVETERVLATLAGLPDAMRSSMQKDLEADRPLELDAIGGAVSRRGAAHDVPTPVVTELLGLVAARAGPTGPR